MPRVSRRDVIRMAAMGMPVFAAVSTEHTHAAAELPPVGEATPNGVIVRQANPDNLEGPFADGLSEITQNGHFFVRSHFAVPEIDSATWRLRIEGHVNQAVELSLEQLKSLPQVSHQATLECAGNTRGYLSPAVKGVQWNLGAVGNAAWSGVRLSDVLKLAGVKRGALEVVFEGADTGEIKDPPRPTGTIHFARSMPISRAHQEDVILALSMNGEPLPKSHGGPMRVLVPGWYAVASVKWLARIVVTDRPFTGHFQTVDYAYWERRNGLPNRIPVSEMQTKAEISRPAPGEVLAADKPYRITGAAWTGDSQIQKVEISDDGGTTWKLAKLIGKPVRHTWRLWQFDWITPSTAQTSTLLARATDARGSVQPMQRQPDRENYMINHVIPIKVNIRS